VPGADDIERAPKTPIRPHISRPLLSLPADRARETTTSPFAGKAEASSGPLLRAITNYTARMPGTAVLRGFHEINHIIG